MDPRFRKTGRFLLILLILGGVLLSGPVHHALHDASEGLHCDACVLGSTEPPDSILVPGPAVAHRFAKDVPPAEVFVAAVPTVGSPRGPPASA